jgi:dnd system-associated protein 4
MPRVRRPADKEELLNRLTARDANGPFATYKDVLVFAAALGYMNKRREPFSKSSEPIDLSVFSGFGDEAIINMLPVADEERLELLAPDHFDERIRWFEEYANGGLAILQQRLAVYNTEPLDVILGLMQGARTQHEPLEPNWEALAEKLF